MVIISNFFNEKHFKYFLNKYKDLPITLFIDSIPNKTQLSLNPYNFLLIHEPNELFGLHNWALQNYHLFHGIFTYNKALLNSIPNAVEFYYNGMTSENVNQYESYLKDKEKKFEVSFLCGTKDIAEGHKLRQQIYLLKDQIIIPKQWFYILEDFDSSTNTRPGYTEYSKDLSHVPEDWAPDVWGKKHLYENSMFHIAVDNSFSENWYTEKIGQAFISKTLPIYWGCPNLEDIGYDERGIIRFQTKEELINILNNLTPEDYFSRLPYIEYNYQVSLQDNFRTKLSYILDQLKELNNL